MEINWSKKRVFVTGCTGFLGSWLTDKLVEKKAIVYGLIHDMQPNNRFGDKSFEKINFIKGELEDYSFLERIIEKFEIDFIFHTAAQTQVLTANKNPKETFKTNIEGTWNLLESARVKQPSPMVIVASSDKAYGIQKNLPYTEDAPLKGTYPYDVSKSCVDLIAQAYFHSFGLPVCITRCGNIYGGRDLNFARLVPGTIKSIINQENPIIRSDGTFRRDYNYVESIVDGYLLLAEQMVFNPKIYGEAFNLSNDNPKSALEIVGKILEIMGANKVRPEILSSAKNEIPHQFLSASKAKKVLDWKPSYSLDKGLIKTIAWYKEYFKQL